MLCTDSKCYCYDFVNTTQKICIEFNGDYWHCNPNKYDKNFMHEIINETAENIWKKDKKKIDLIKNNGYTVIIIWERDWKENSNKCLKKVKNEICIKK